MYKLVCKKCDWIGYSDFKPPYVICPKCHEKVLILKEKEKSKEVKSR